MLSGRSSSSAASSLGHQSPQSLVSTPDSFVSSPTVNNNNNPADLFCSISSSLLYATNNTISQQTSFAAIQKPLLITNPIYQSPFVQRRSAESRTNHPTIASTAPQWQQGTHPDDNTSPISTDANSPQMSSAVQLHHWRQPPQPLVNKRTISMQTVRNDDYEPGGSFEYSINRAGSTLIIPTNKSNCDPLFCHGGILIDCASATVMDWLNEMALAKLARLYENYSSDMIGGSNRWYKRVQMLKNVRSVIRQVKDKANLTANGASAPADVPSSSCSLYGAPLSDTQPKTSDGGPLPRFVHDMMHWLAKQAQSSDGMFRKNGVKVRIQEIKDACNKLSANQPIPDHLLADSQLHDVADALKQYFRELPDCLITGRVSEILENMVSELSEEQHFDALRYCILLLPSEHREALLVLLRFLNGITRYSLTNQMTSGCLATCWMPTLFHLAHFESSIGGGSKRRLIRRKTIAMPNEKERKAYEAVKRILTTMIDQWERLQYLPNDLAREISNSKEVCHDLEMPTKNGQFDFSEELQLYFRQQLFRMKEDYLSGWKSWNLQRVFHDGSQLFTRTINDMIQLKAFRVQTSIAASPNVILAAILHNRHFWDTQVKECRRIGPSGQNFDILKMSYKSLLGDEVEKQVFLARRWRYSDFDNDRVGLLVERSIIPRIGWRTQQLAGNQVSIYKSEFLVVPVCAGHSYVSYISRADFRGRSSDWYEKVYGAMLVHHLHCLKRHVLRCQNGFQGTIV